jgi:RND family efflux transporter MFP subunit
VRPIHLAPLLLLLVAACGKAPAPPAEVVRPVLSMVVAARIATIPGFVGTIEPRVTTNLAFRVGGRLVSRPADVGQSVAKGQVLASLDTTSLDLAVRSAEADLSSAQSQLSLASAEETRQRSLLQSNNVAQSAVDAAVQQRQAAQSGVTRAQSALSKAQQELGFAEIAADYDAVVTAVSAQIGQVVSAGQTVLTIAEPSARDAVVDVPDFLSADIRTGTRFDVALQLDPSIRASGSVSEIAPQADQATRTRRIKIALDNPPDTFWLGTTVAATLAGAATETLAVPASAVFEDNGASKVWIVDAAGKTVASRTVTTGPATPDGFVPVTSGLTAGERVVTAGVHSLREGQRVRVDGAVAS